MGGLAERVKELRQARGETQTSLAERAGLTQPTIARLEAGQVPTIRTLARLAQALDFDPLEFIAGEDPAAR